MMRVRCFLPLVCFLLISTIATYTTQAASVQTTIKLRTNINTKGELNKLTSSTSTSTSQLQHNVDPGTPDNNEATPVQPPQNTENTENTATTTNNNNPSTPATQANPLAHAVDASSVAHQGAGHQPITNPLHLEGAARGVSPLSRSSTSTTAASLSPLVSDYIRLADGSTVFSHPPSPITMYLKYYFTPACEVCRQKTIPTLKRALKFFAGQNIRLTFVNMDAAVMNSQSQNVFYPGMLISYTAVPGDGISPSSPALELDRTFGYPAVHPEYSFKSFIANSLVSQPRVLNMIQSARERTQPPNILDQFAQRIAEARNMH